jgi:hypothetical protein
MRAPECSVPIAWAASSTMEIPLRLARPRIGPRSTAAPAKWTGTIILVLSEILSAMVSGVTIRVSRSTSAKTGVAPASTIRLTVETHVRDGVMTSSPGPIPRAARVRCMPAVAEERPTAPDAPTYLQNACSNSAATGPVVIHPERSTPATAAISASLMEGFENGRNSLRIGWPVSKRASCRLYLTFAVEHLFAISRRAPVGHGHSIRSGMAKALRTPDAGGTPALPGGRRGEHVIEDTALLAPPSACRTRRTAPAERRD